MRSVKLSQKACARAIHQVMRGSHNGFQQSAASANIFLFYGEILDAGNDLLPSGKLG